MQKSFNFQFKRIAFISNSTHCVLVVKVWGDASRSIVLFYAQSIYRFLIPASISYIQIVALDGRQPAVDPLSDLLPVSLDARCHCANEMDFLTFSAPITRANAVESERPRIYTHSHHTQKQHTLVRTLGAQTDKQPHTYVSIIVVGRDN